MLSSDCEFTYVTNFILSIIRLVQFNWSIWIYFRYSWLNILGCLRTNRQVRSSHKWMGWWRFEIFRDLCQFQGSFRFNKLYKLYLIYSKNEIFYFSWIFIEAQNQDFSIHGMRKYVRQIYLRSSILIAAIPCILILPQPRPFRKIMFHRT